MRGPGLGSRLGSAIYRLRDPGQATATQTAGASTRPFRNPHLEMDTISCGQRRTHTQVTISACLHLMFNSECE